MTEDIFAKKDRLTAQLKKAPEDAATIEDFRDESFALISEISELSDADTAVLKAGVDLICECCLTRISVKRTGGYETSAPLIISPERRVFCAEKYDEWTDIIKTSERAYIPPYFERYAPDREKLRFLQKSYLTAKSDSSVKAQQEGRSFNRLFGGRG